MEDKLILATRAARTAAELGALPCDPRLLKLLALIEKRFEDDDAKAWSSMSSEIARKALDVTSRAAFRYVDNEITEREFGLICDGVYDTITGLVPWKECADVIYAMRQEALK